MKLKKYCFAINTTTQANDVIKFCKAKKIKPIFYIKYFLINKLGVDWLIELEEIIKKKTKTKNFEIYVNVKKNYGLFIELVDHKIAYLNIQGEIKIMKKLKQIAKQNKVSINPDFSIIDISKIIDINKKLHKIKI